MRKLNLLSALMLVCFAAVGITGQAGGIGTSEVAGTFGLTNTTDDTAVAVWIPLAAGESVIAVEWYQEEACELAAITALAARDGRPDILADGIEITGDLSNPESGWSETALAQPVASRSGGVFVVLKTRDRSRGTSEAASARFGYVPSDKSNTMAWITADGVAWHPIAEGYLPAISARLSVNKAADVLFVDGDRGNDGSPEPTRVSESPLVFSGLAVHPNPSNPRTTNSFFQTHAQTAEVVVYDLRGRRIRTLHAGFLDSGAHEIDWDGRDNSGRGVASGVYFVKYRSGNTVRVNRVTLVR